MISFFCNIPNQKDYNIGLILYILFITFVIICMYEPTHLILDCSHQCNPLVFDCRNHSFDHNHIQVE